MKKTVLLLFTLSLFTINSNAQTIISVEKLATLTVDSMEAILANQGVPTFAIAPVYDVDYYRVLYKTPWKHSDSLVQASGAIVVPKNYACGLPIGAFGHGTQSRRSTTASRMNGGIWEVGAAFASTGYIICMPDYLGLGFPDPKVPIHPYTHAFSQGHTAINILRAARELADSLNTALNEQVFLFGYSQGGFMTAAAHKIIEEEFSNEFTVTASAPMSGPYDLKDVQVDLIVSDSIYPTPGYLPFILYSYREMFEDIDAAYPHDSLVFIPPYDTILPNAFFRDDLSIGQINNLCPGVPKHVLIDSIVDQFIADTNHILRQRLAESHLLDWTPQAPIKLMYCMGDDQVTYENAIKAYDSWTARGATDIEKADFGDKNHYDCALFAFLATKNYFDAKKEYCVGITENNYNSFIKVFPNPANSFVQLEFGDSKYNEVIITDVLGKTVFTAEFYQSSARLDLSQWQSGVYFITISNGTSEVIEKLIKQ